MLCGAFAFATSADEGQNAPAIAGIDTTNTKPTVHYFTGQSIKEVKTTTGENETITYEASGDKVIYNKEDKLANMELRLRKNGYCLYVDEYSGEVATYCEATGEVLFSNPYNIGDSVANGDDKTPSVKGELMSQLAVNFTDVTGGDSTTYYSYEWAAKRGQINVRDIKNGIRVEYTIGREEARMLVPRQIEKSAFETKIRDVMAEAVKGDKDAEFQLKKLLAYYMIQDPNTVSATLKTQMLSQYPITKTGMAIYVLDSSAANAEIAKIEQYIKTYCPNYTYEELDEDHMQTQYEAEDKNPPLFKMALEYTLDGTGVTVRLPANGIRFNEALYQLNYVQILPYMGAGTNSTKNTSVMQDNNGYTFFPDGSGSLFEFEKIADAGQSFMASGKVYGADYAYHTITGKHQEIIRYPVYGVKSEENLAIVAEAKRLREEYETAKAGGDTEAKEEKLELTAEEIEALNKAYGTNYLDNSGFVAIVEEGDALMELSTNHDISRHEYNSVIMKVYPRPQDTYDVADSISVSGSQNTEWTVVSSRKYTGNYKIKFTMLTDENVAAEKGITNYFGCDYVGMAKAYRSYLESTGVLTRLTTENVKEDIPLYIETFGALTTTERFLSIPVEVMTPLTTFGDIQTMYNEMSAQGVDNINFILTGFTKGGLSEPQVPYNLKWDGAVSDEVKFDDLLADAKAKGYGIYPDFDFAYTQSSGMFDGLSLKKHAVKTIDDRYTLRSEYSATKQTYVNYFDLAISPAYFSHFYEKLTKNYLKYEPMGISVSTLGSDLNSDFDEDEPFNREDSKRFTVDAFEYLDQNYGKVMTSSANAYTWKYVDYITDIALDSSRYSQAWASVPFLGMVLHGYVEIAGTPLNMEGNIDYAILKAIENGASLNFTLSYRNTNNLKNNEVLSQYYSVRYDIWFDDVVEIYNELNGVLAGVQTSTIERHEFISDAHRVPDKDELKSDSKRVLDAIIEGRGDYAFELAEYEKDSLRNAKLRLDELIPLLEQDADATNADGAYAKALKALNDIVGTGGTLETTKTALDAAIAAYNKADQTLVSNFENAYAAYVDAVDSAKTKTQNLLVVLLEITQNQAGVAYYHDLLKDSKYDGDVTTVTGYTFAEGTNDIQALFTYYNNQLKTVVTDAKDFVNGPNGVAQFEGDGKDYTGQIKDVEDYTYVITEPDAEENADEAYSEYKLTIDSFKMNDPVKPTDKTNTDAASYEVDTNKIVYEEYSNGTAFLLNFNNYKVIATVDGVAYTIDAYGYIILKRGN